LAAVAARVVTVPGSAISVFRAAIGRGVVVITSRGSSPSLRPSRSMANTSLGRRQAQNSSHQAAWNCGPRRLSASSAEKAWAVAPFGHVSRRRPAS